MPWTNRQKSTSGTFGDLDPTDIGDLTPTDIVPGTIPAITMGEATPTTPIYQVWSSRSKSASPTWTNRSKSSDPTWTNRSKTP